MSVLAILSLVLMSSVPAEVERDGVRIEVDVRGQLYVWTVTNLEAERIMNFRIDAVHTYNHKVPKGWVAQYEEPVFTALATDERYGILRGERGVFKAAEAVSTGVLGAVPVVIGFDGDTPPVEFAEVWGPVRKPLSMIITVPLTITGIALAHLMLVVRRERRRG